jgi:hypothetical protein
MGRKRKSGARAKSGRLSRAYRTVARDTGTAEGLARRIWLVDGSDPALAASAAGVLLARDVITRAMYAAACRFAWLHSAVFGLPYRQLCILGKEPGPSGPGLDDETIAERRAELAAMERRLTLAQRQAVASLCCYGVVPPWHFALLGIGRLLPGDEHDRQALLTGLRAIAGPGVDAPEGRWIVSHQLRHGPCAKR